MLPVHFRGPSNRVKRGPVVYGVNMGPVDEVIRGPVYEAKRTSR